MRNGNSPRSDGANHQGKALQRSGLDLGAHNGYRALLIKEGERISLQTRKGNDLLQFFPEIAADLRKLPDIAIDGELVMLDANGKPEFHQLRGRCAMRGPERIGRAAVSKPAAVFAFDLLQLRGKDLRACLYSSAKPRFRRN